MLLVYPLQNGNYIVIAGNMRLRACKELGFKELPCYVFAKDTPIDKLREYTIKDNANFGNWDYDILANESWSDDIDLLAEWGAPVEFLNNVDDEVNIDDLFEEASNTEEKEQVTKITVVVPQSLSDALEEIKSTIRESIASYEGVEIK